jgi:pilus assembly protein CpaC
MFSHLIGRMPFVRSCAPLMLVSSFAAIVGAQELNPPLQSPNGFQAPSGFQTPGPIQTPGPTQTPGPIQMPGPTQNAEAFQPAAPGTRPQWTSDPAVHHVQATNERMEMVANSSRVITLDQNIPRAQVNNREILELNALSPREIQVFAKKPGVTQINLWNDKGQLYTIDCVVSGDARELMELIRSEFPNANIRVRPLASSVLLTGTIDRADQVSRIIEVAQDFYPTVKSNIEVVSVQQVLLHCKVAEVDRTKLRSLGFDFANLSESGSFFVSSVSGLISAVSNTARTVNHAGDTVSFGVVDGGNGFFGFLEALRQDEILKILSDPTVTTVSGRAASFIVGGEFPILVPQSLGTVSIEYKEFGTQIDFVPIVMGNGNIRLEVRPRISEIDETRSITINGSTVPGLRVRQVDTGVEMKPGQTLALAGLVQTRIAGRRRGIPWLMEMPYIGAAFRTVRQREEEIELVILVTPELAAGLDPCEVPKCLPGMHTDVPNDCEMFWKGYIEVPSKGPCGPNDCGPNGCGPNGCGPDGVNPAAMYYDVPPGQQQGPPAQSYETIPPGTPGSRAPAGHSTTSSRPPASASRGAPQGVPQIGANSGVRYNPTLQQNPPRPQGTKPPTAAPGFIGPVGYDVKN